MKTKIFTLVFGCFLWLNAFNATAQNLYEIKFTDEAKNTYKGFMVYFNEKECYMRIAYTIDKKYNVVNVEYNSSNMTEDKVNYFIMNGSNPTFITAKTAQQGDYNPDTFIWAFTEKDNKDKADDEDGLPYTSDDPDFKPETFRKVDSYTAVKANQLNDTYLKQFFRTDEPQYKLLKQIWTDTQTQTNTNTNTNTNAGTNTTSNADIKLHVIMVSNSLIGDIGESCAADARVVVNEFDGIAESLGIKLEKYLINDKNFTKQNINKTIDNINPGKNDIVVFAYSGHGFRWSNQTDKYPYMALTYNNYQKLSQETSMGLSEVYNKLIKKGARLNLVFGDCCNSDIGVNQTVESNSLATRSNVSLKKEKLEKLFIKSKGNIMIAGASPGEFSYCNNTGGFFLTSFLQALHEEISYLRTDVADWDGLLSNTIKYTKSKAGNKPQNPIKLGTISYK